MDVLSDVLAVMRTGRPLSVRVGRQAPWAQEFAAVPGAAGFHVVLSGQCWMMLDGHDPLRLEAGDVVFRPHGRAHTLADDPATRPVTPSCRPGQVPPAPPPAVGDTVTLCGAYEMDPALVHPLIHDLPEVVHRPAGRDDALGSAVGLLAAELAGPGPGTDALVPVLLDALLLYLLREVLGDGGGWPAALRDPAVGAALRAVHRDPARRWTVAGLAAEARLSRAPFARRFTDLVGQPPLAYLTWWRMTTAARLLRAGDAPLATVAREVGYTSEYAFATAFKRRHGIAPGRFRARRPTPPR